MKKKMNIYKIVIVIYLLLETRFFYLFSIGSLENFITYKNKLLISLITILTSIILILLRKKVNKCPVNKWCFAFILYVIFEAVKNGIVYKYGWNGVFLACHGYLLLVLCFLINTNSEKEELYEFIVKVISIFSIILSSLFILQVFLYDNFGISFLKIYEYQNLNMAEKRNFGIRLTFPSTLIIFSLLISWGQLRANNKNKLHYINFYISLIYVIFICQTRMTTIAILTTIFLTILFRKFSKGIRKLIIGIIAIVVIIAPFKIGKIFSNDDSGSVYARTYAIEYYTRQFLTQPIFGIGVLPDDNTSILIYEILHGNKGYANITDVGLVGFIFQFGIVGILLLVYLTKIVYNALKKNNTHKDKYYSLLSCIIYILITSSTLSIFDVQRIVILPIILFMVFNIDGTKSIENEKNTKILERVN